MISDHAPLSIANLTKGTSKTSLVTEAAGSPDLWSNGNKVFSGSLANFTNAAINPNGLYTSGTSWADGDWNGEWWFNGGCLYNGFPAKGKNGVVCPTVQAINTTTDRAWGLTPSIQGELIACLPTAACSSCRSR